MIGILILMVFAIASLYMSVTAENEHLKTRLLVAFYANLILAFLVARL